MEQNPKAHVKLAMGNLESEGKKSRKDQEK
jgi:hypothetical protein